MAIVDEINCSHCGAPIAFNPGEMLATCKYCGYTVVIETGKAFTFDHSLLLNRYDPASVEEPIRSWMSGGFLKPSDMARKSKITEKNLVYLPFWLVTAEAKSSYKGIFERITPAIVREGTLEKKYDWLVFATRVVSFPVKEYSVPLEGKIPYDFRKIESFAKVLNSEVDKDKAVELARQQIDEHHRFLIMQDVDRIINMKTDFELGQAVYLHAPVWFVKFEYKGKSYQLLLDGVTGNAIKGDIPSTGFGLL